MIYVTYFSRLLKIQRASVLMGTFNLWIRAIFREMAWLMAFLRNWLLDKDLACKDIEKWDFGGNFQTVFKITGMYSSRRPPANTPISLGPNFRSDKMAKMTFSVTIPVIKDSGVSCSKGIKVLPKIRNNTCRGSRSWVLMFGGSPTKKIRLDKPSLWKIKI